MGVSMFGGPIGKAFCIVSAFVLALFFVVDDVVLIHFLNVILMAVAAGVAVAYMPLAREAYHHPVPRETHVYAFGVFLIWLGLFISRVIAISVRSGFAPWLSDTDAVSLFMVLILIGGAHKLNAHKVEDGGLPPAQWVKFGIIVASGMLVAAMLMNFKYLVNFI